MPEGPRWPALLLAAALVCGCASSERRAAPKDAGGPEPTVVAPAEYRDPLIAVNRAIFAFNDFTYRRVLIPVSKGYVRAVPAPARRSVGNFFHNIRTPIYVANDLLQLEPRPLGRHLARFVVNSTVGVGGLFDPARKWFGLEKTATGFEDTLSGYGVGYGIYLVLPIFGSSDIRHGVSMVADYFLNPIPYLTENPATSAVMSYDNFHEFSAEADEYEELRRRLDDPYIFFRNLHLQGVQRDAEH